MEEAVAEGGVVLVNCWAGQNRSGAVLLAWLLTHRDPDTGAALGFTPQGATDHLRSIEPAALNNESLQRCVVEMLEDGTATTGCVQLLEPAGTGNARLLQLPPRPPTRPAAEPFEEPVEEGVVLEPLF
mmetsp:Transcript_103034/g.322169  ORF Transcript_103034/g.322169 Transcript_103034/m.322169 type:complete len:128 (+) Transcript_103034:82-465(+)